MASSTDAHPAVSSAKDMTPAQKRRTLTDAFDRISDSSRTYLCNLALTLAASEFKGAPASTPA